MAWAGMKARWRTEIKDLLELVLLPGLAAVLPWRWAFALFRRMAHWRWLYRAQCDRALVEAHRRGWAPSDPAGQRQWLWQRRLTTLVDHADLYLGLTRSNRWMARHLSVQGAWPAPEQAAVLATFHWGAGMWGLRHAQAHGMKPHALVAALQGAHFKGRAVLHRYAIARTAAVTRALGRPTMDVSVSLRPAIKALRQREQVLAAIDVPADQVVASETVALAGLPARVPRGLLRLAVDQQVPLVVYITGLNHETGERFLRIRSLGVATDVAPLVQSVFADLDALIRECPPAWHFWAESERFFVAPDA